MWREPLGYSGSVVLFRGVIVALVILIACRPVNVEPRATSYGWSDSGTIHWEGGESRLLAQEKFLGVMGTSATLLHVSFVVHEQTVPVAVSHQHGQAFVVSLTGTHVLSLSDGRVLRIAPLQAASERLDFGPYRHSVEGENNSWLSVALRSPEATMAELTVFPSSSRLAYDTPPLPIGAHRQNGAAVRLVELKSGGATGIRRPVGVLVIYVLEGVLDLRRGARSGETVRAGEGRYLRPGEASRWVNTGPVTARVLEIYVADSGDSSAPGVYLEELVKWP